MNIHVMQTQAKIIILIFVLIFDPCFGETIENWRLIYPEFDLSLSYYKNNLNYIKYYLNNDTEFPPNYILQKNKFQLLYETDRQKSTLSLDAYKIPRIIHQIWLGGTLPEKYQAWVKTWQNWKDWDYYLWTDENVKTLTLYNAELYETANNYGEKSDILRYEILHQLGGLYIDIDVECVHPNFFEFAHQNYSFYVGIEPVERKSIFSTGNAVLASAPHHPLMECIVTSLPLHVEDYVKKNPHSLSQETVKKTGPHYMHQIIYENIELLMQEGVIFPPTFFFPPVKCRPPLYLWPETVAIHYWEGSWNRITAN